MSGQDVVFQSLFHPQFFGTRALSQPVQANAFITLLPINSPTGAVSDAAALRFPEAAAWTGVDGITGFHVRGMALGLGPGHQDDTPRPQKLPTQTSSLPSSVRDNIAYFCS